MSTQPQRKVGQANSYVNAPQGLINLQRIIIIIIKDTELWGEQNAEKTCPEIKDKAGIKGLQRMVNKMMDDIDHCWNPMPRPAHNIDQVRNNVVFPDPESMIRGIAVLLKTFHLIRAKNKFVPMMEQYTARVMLLNMLYKGIPGQLWKHLFASKETLERWDKVCADVCKLHKITPPIFDER